MAITFVNAGTFASASSADMVVSQPASTAANDLLLLCIESANNAITIQSPSGWVEVTNSPQGQGSTTVGSRLTVFWKIDSGSESSVTVNGTTNHQDGVIFAFRGVDPTSPFDVTAGSTEANTASCVFPAVVTTAMGRTIALIQSTGRDATATNGSIGAATNSNLASITQRFDQTTATNGGGGIVLITGTMATAASTGTTTATSTSTEDHEYLTIALKPLPHSTSGTLVGSGSGLSGSAARFREMATSGALIGSGSAISGSAARFRAFGTSGNLIGSGGTLVGSAVRFRAFNTSGNLTGAGSSISGNAARFREMSTSGNLVGSGSTIIGDAERIATNGAITHDTSGALVGAGAALSGTATRIAAAPDFVPMGGGGGHYWPHHDARRRPIIYRKPVVAPKNKVKKKKEFDAEAYAIQMAELFAEKQREIDEKLKQIDEQFKDSNTAA